MSNDKNDRHVALLHAFVRGTTQSSQLVTECRRQLPPHVNQSDSDAKSVADHGGCRSVHERVSSRCLLGDPDRVQPEILGAPGQRCDSLAVGIRR